MSQRNWKPGLGFDGGVIIARPFCAGEDYTKEASR
jgi:hypothetical protein